MRRVLCLCALVGAGCGRLGYDGLGADGGGGIDPTDAAIDAEPGSVVDAATVPDAPPGTADGGSQTAKTHISASSGDARRPALVFADDGFLVTWDDTRGAGGEIYAARIDLAGAKLGGDVKVTSTSGGSCCTAAAWDGSTLGVAYEGPQNKVYFTRLDADGAALDPPFAVSGGQPMAYNVAVGAGGGQFGVSWDNAAASGALNLWCASVAAAGGSATTPVRRNSDTTDATFPTVAWADGELGVAWEDGRNGTNREMYFARCSASGALVGSEVRESLGDGDAHFGSLAFDGSHYGLAWEDDRDGTGDVYFALLDGTGAKLGSDVKVSAGLTGRAREASLVWGQDRFGLVWVQADEVVFAELDASGAIVKAPVVVAAEAGATTQDPSLVFGNGVFGLAWESDAAGSWAIDFRLLAP